MVLTEKQNIDLNIGCLAGNDFASYYIPINTDVLLIEVSFINKLYYNRNPIGVFFNDFHLLTIDQKLAGLKS